MKAWIATALVAIALACSASASASERGVARAKPQAAVESQATDVTARRVHRRSVYRPAALPYYPTYYARPVYYRPYPYGVPAPFFLGFAYLPPYW